MDFAKKSASICYKPVLDMINQNQQKLKIFRSVIPIKCCSCCSKFDCTLKMCWVCVDNTDFPDIHWFCSSECEQKSLDAGHMEKHDHDLMVKCGLV